MHRLLIVVSCLISLSVSSKVLISEEKLVQFAEKSPPSIQEIELALHGVKVRQLQYEENFQTGLSAGGSYYSTEEDQFSTFIPVNSPVSSYSVAVTKNTRKGISLSVSGTRDRFSNNFVQKATTTTVGAEITLDLYKDFLGRSTEKNIDLLNKEYLQKLVETEIQKKNFKNSIRKIYWNLVANAEKIKITKEQLKASEKQVREAKKRLRNGIADKGEVSKYQSQASIRKSQIILYEYERSNLIQQLKELFPELKDEEIELGQYNMPEAIGTVLACSAKISKRLDAPMEFTKYDEIVDLLKERKKREVAINDDYTKPDISLSSGVNMIGKGTEVTNSSYDNLTEENNLAYSVSLNVSLALDDKKDQTKEVLQKIAKKKYLLERQKSLSKVVAYHSETLNKIRMLQQILLNQNQNISYLQDSLKVTQKKFNQARIDVQQLVQEQEAYLQSYVDEIDTKLIVINTLLDYLSVYTNFPCHLNRF